ncbi:WD and tetratricopeptide repeat protein [Colletotrichum truncatum]|uniref:WD and tetratricopeptide repeat protein n=1 Tax=Colletotrichum truncatum TaxID=5467 RepID=A0ACC3YIW2_COLTU|nr:WD and tetratricopeptide repeat protein [Colletotrichum truncatum]KAF6794310.1 WD and tetratricopeptide repeat protein [Colletotrichum truncatum]
MSTSSTGNESPLEDDNSIRLQELQSLRDRRQELTKALRELPYDLILYLERAKVHSDLGYPDLAVGDAYRALLLTDEVLNEGFEYHEQAVESLQSRPLDPLPLVLDHGHLTDLGSDYVDNEAKDQAGLVRHVARLSSVRCYQILSLSLLLCSCLKSSYDFAERGLALAPENEELLETFGYINKIARQRLRREDINPNILPEWGMVRREVYPWNDHEPDRYGPKTLEFLNKQLSQFSPKCEVRVSKLPILLDEASETDDYDFIPTCEQLGLFAKEDIAPGETVLEEYSLLTANNRHKEPVCDACGADLPPLGPDSTAVNCEECYDTVFCSQYCHDLAQELYHPAVCEKDVDDIKKDPEASEAAETLNLLLLARVLALSQHQGIHPLDLPQVKYIWGDFLPTSVNNIDISPSPMPPPDWTLRFSFEYNVKAPLHILEKMDVDIYTTLPENDLWVFNTLYSKFRGTASSRKNPRDGRPEVAAVHPFWCIANHDCNPNVTWDWAGRMVLWARKEKIMGDKPGLKAGEEVLNHYTDIRMSVDERREWAKGSLGGSCMCSRCRSEAAAAATTAKKA